MNGFSEYKAVSVSGTKPDEVLYFKSTGADLWDDARKAFEAAYGHRNVTAISLSSAGH